MQAQSSNRRVNDRRKEILRAAAACFRDAGFHAAGMRDIAQRAGMTVGNLYYYFRNKEELLAFCQEETLNRLERRLRRARAAPRRADGRLWMLVAGHVACLNDGVGGSLAHLEVPGLDAAGGSRLRQSRDRYERAIRAVIREGRAQGVFRDTDEKLAAMAILGAANWTVRWFDPSRGASAVEIGAAFADQLVRGLLAEGVVLERPEEHEIPFDLENDHG